MTPTQIRATVELVKGLWPRASKRTDMEWSVFMEGAARIDIDLEQATASLRNLLANSEKYPSVKVLLESLRNALPRVGPNTPLYAVKPLPDDYPVNEHGRTSFEQRVIDDPKFAEFMELNGRLPPERAAKLLGANWNARPKKFYAAPVRIELHKAIQKVVSAQ